MISKKMAKKLNEQVANEYGSWWIYLQMSYKLESMGLQVFARWFDAQATEEQVHAQKIANYILDQGAEVELAELPKPEANYKTVAEICKAGLDHEIKVTNQINALAKLAATEHDFASGSFLNWFVDEQVEEVATSSQLLDLVKMAKTPDQLLLLENRIMDLRGGGGGGQAA